MAIIRVWDRYYCMLMGVEAMETKSTEPILQQIMGSLAEVLKKLMDNENRSSFTLITQMQLLERCQKETRLLLRRRFLYNVLEMARQEAVINWKKYTAEVLSAVQSFNTPSRYCGILFPIRVLPSFVDRLVQAKAASDVCSKRLVTALQREGPVHNRLREIHAEVNASLPAESGTSTTTMTQDLQDGGLGLIGLVTKKLRSKIDEIADREAKYKDLIRMENYRFLKVSLELRHVATLEPFLKECEELYGKVSM